MCLGVVIGSTRRPCKREEEGRGKGWAGFSTVLVAKRTGGGGEGKAPYVVCTGAQCEMSQGTV